MGDNFLYHISSFYPNYFMDRLISYVAIRLTNYFNDVEGISANIMGLCSDSSVNSYMKNTNRFFYQDAINKNLWPFYRRFFSQKKLIKIGEEKYLKQLNAGDIAYLWPTTSLKVYKAAKKRGCIIASERINSLRGNSKLLQDKECEALGVTPCHDITEDSISVENEKMSLCDYIFSPAPGITESLQAINIDDEHIIETSYGLRRSEILPPKEDTEYESDNLRVIFVGSIGVRKGIHLLLSAWHKSNIKGQLTIVGRISPESAEIVNNFLHIDRTIEHLDFVNDLTPIYKNADVLCLTSIEEGSPLVTYLGFGASVPFVGSYMGAGGIVQDGVNGLIVDAHDEGAIIEALKKYAIDKEFRKKTSIAARESAFQYTWDLVAKQRAKELIRRIEA